MAVYTLHINVAEFSLNLKKSWFLMRSRVLKAISILKNKKAQLSDCRIVGNWSGDYCRVTFYVTLLAWATYDRSVILNLFQDPLKFAYYWWDPETSSGWRSDHGSGLPCMMPRHNSCNTTLLFKKYFGSESSDHLYEIVTIWANSFSYSTFNPFNSFWWLEKQINCRKEDPRNRMAYNKW